MHSQTSFLSTRCHIDPVIERMENTKFFFKWRTVIPAKNKIQVSLEFLFCYKKLKKYFLLQKSTSLIWFQPRARSNLKLEVVVIYQLITHHRWDMWIWNVNVIKPGRQKQKKSERSLPLYNFICQKSCGLSWDWTLVHIFNIKIYDWLLLSITQECTKI
jgi:hypothetical protein